jgi:A/G-specific adenine glycosylase
VPENSKYSENEGRERFARELLIWWQQNKRDFPWRKTSNPYLILITEMLLRKTTAGQVAATYEKFFSKYPDLAKLSEASTEELEQLIRPLGMERKRAVLLKAISQELIERHSGKVPLSEKELLELPGVGPYAANAVLCFAHGEDVPLVDTNAIRVFQRVFGLTSRKRRPKDDLLIWKFAKSYIPPTRGRDFNLAIIDLAHKICTPRKPKHVICPLRALCKYAKGENQN